MKLSLKILSFIVFLTASLNAQWFQLSSGTSNTLFDINFGDSVSGNAAGLTSTITRTTNAGVNWVLQPNPAATHLYCIYFVNPLTGFAGGEISRAVKTTNGGSNWSLLTLPISENLSGIFFNDANTGYISAWNGKIIKTTNSGLNWTLLISGINTQVIKIHFANYNTGFASSTSGMIIKTTDAGQTWNQLTTNITQTVIGVFAASADTIYAVCDAGKIIKSTNGGSTWVQQTSGTNERLTAVYFVNSLTGTAIGLNSTIRRTTNGGASWLTQLSGVSGIDFWGVYFTSVTTGYVSGGNGTILKTITGGFPYPSQPVLVSPVNGATAISLTPTLDWDSAAAAETYELQLGTDSLFTNPVLDTSLLINTQMSVPPGRLANYTWYYWHVRGKNIVGVGLYSSTFRFRTIAPFPFPPTLLLPVNGASNVSLTPTFDWDSTIITTYYTLQGSLDTSFTNNPVYHTGITQSFLTITSPPLQYNSRYYWHVSTTNDAGTSPWSTVFNFTTIIGPPAPPTLLSPPNGTIGVSLTPTMKWVEDISALNYQCQISSDSTFVVSSEIDTTVTDSNQVTIRPGVLVNVHNYFWRVRTTNSIGTSPWSDVWKFFTLLSPPAAPQLFSPQNDTINVSLTPTLNWNDV